MAETVEGLKQWLDINYPKKLPFETVTTSGLPTDTPMNPAIIRYSTTDEQIYSWSIDNGVGSWKIGMGGSGSGIEYELKDVNFTIFKGKGYLCDVSSVSTNMTVTFATSDTFTTGDFFEVLVVKGDSSTKNIIIDFKNGSQLLEGLSDNFYMNFNGYFRFIYVNATIGWKVIPISVFGSTTKEYISTKNTDFITENNGIYLVDTTSNIVNVTIPTNIQYPYKFRIIDFKNTSPNKNIVINFTSNGYKFQSYLSNYTINSSLYMYDFMATDSLYGFKLVKTANDILENNQVIKSSSFTIENNTTYFIDTTTNVVTATLPANIIYPFRFKIIDAKGNFATRYTTVNFISNGYKLDGNSINDKLNTNGTSCEYVAVNSTYGFRKIETKSSNIDVHTVAKAYKKGDRVYYFGILAEANDDVGQYVSFAWGISGVTWKPINIYGNWRGVYSSANSYSAGDLVVKYDGEGVIYRLVGTNINANDTNYSPSSGKYRDKWKPISMNMLPWMEGATSTTNGSEGVCKPPQIGDQEKYWCGDANWKSPFVVGEVKSIATPNIPTGWLECTGSTVSRTTYADLFNALTISDTASPTTGSKTVTCLDTSKLTSGMVVEFGSGTWGYTIASIDSATTYSLDVTCNDMTGSQTARYFLYGNGGNGTRDLFNLPNMIGRTIVGSGQGKLDINFVSSNINISTDIITIPITKSLYTGTEVKVITNGTIPTGLTNNGTYYIIKVSDTTIKLANSLGNALNGSAVDISAVGSGSHILRITYSNRGLGELGGEEKHLQTQSELVPHKHTIDDTYSTQWTKDGWGDSQSSTDEISRPEDTSTVGGGQPFNIMSPYIAMKYIIKY